MATSSIYTNFEIKDTQAAERLVLALEESERKVKLLPPIEVHYQTQEETDALIRRLKEHYLAV